jgi:hypothetical protein
MAEKARVRERKNTCRSAPAFASATFLRRRRRSSCRGFVSLFLIQFPALLMQEGHEVHMANDGPSGLRAALTFQPDAEVITSPGKSTAARSRRYNSTFRLRIMAGWSYRIRRLTYDEML